MSKKEIFYRYAFEDLVIKKEKFHSHHGWYGINLLQEN